MLSDDYLWTQSEKTMIGGSIHIIRFARSIEAEVRKDDEALIRQMLESMCWAARVMTISEDEAPGYFAAISAGRARLDAT